MKLKQDEGLCVLASWSGGLDSTTMIWELLSAGHYVEAHHVSLHKGPIERAHAELNAVDSLCELFESEFPGKLIFTRSSICLEPRIIRQPDMVTVVTLLGIANAGCSRLPVALARGASKIDFRDPTYPIRRARTVKIWELLIEQDVPIIFPVQDKTKLELWNKLPPRYRERTMSCREPTVEDGNWKHCGNCPSCDELNVSKVPLKRRLRWKPWKPLDLI